MVSLGILMHFGITRFTLCQNVRNAPASSWNLPNYYLILAWIVDIEPIYNDHVYLSYLYSMIIGRFSVFCIFCSCIISDPVCITATGEGTGSLNNKHLDVLENSRNNLHPVTAGKFPWAGQCPVPSSFIVLITIMRMFWVPWKVITNS